MPQEKYDVFVSYAEPDDWWVRGYLLDAINWPSSLPVMTLGFKSDG